MQLHQMYADKRDPTTRKSSEVAFFAALLYVLCWSPTLRKEREGWVAHALKYVI